MSMTFTGLVALFANLGFGPALIQRKDLDDEYISTAFWATAAVGAIIFVVAFLCAPYVAVFFAEPGLAPIIQVSATGFLMTPLNIILTSLMTRKMEFRSLALIDMGCVAVSRAMALVAAMSGLGAWSLVVGDLSVHAVRMPLLFHANRWLPRARFSRSQFAELFSFGGPLLGFNFVNYLGRNLDTLVIGKFLGASVLGYYDLALQVMLKPIQNITNPLTKPLFPALASIKEDRARAGELYRSVVLYISLITFPIMVGLAAVAPEFVVGVLGTKWSPSISTLRILCFVGAVHSIWVTLGDIYLSQGRPDLMLRWAMVYTPTAGLVFLYGIRWGIEGVAVGFAIHTLILWIVQQTHANRYIGLSIPRFFAALFPATTSSLVMLSAVLLMQWWLRYLGFAPIFSLVVLVSVGVLTYLATVFRQRASEIVTAKGFVADRFFCLWHLTLAFLRRSN
jgi:PST family polysaccharide transporter